MLCNKKAIEMNWLWKHLKFFSIFIYLPMICMFDLARNPQILSNPQIFTVFQNTAIRKCNILWEQFYESRKKDITFQTYFTPKRRDGDGQFSWQTRFFSRSEEIVFPSSPSSLAIICYEMDVSHNYWRKSLSRNIRDLSFKTPSYFTQSYFRA